MERYRITPDAARYFCTFTVIDWLPVFVSEAACNIVCESLRFCHDQKYLGIDSFVIMPTHLHMIVLDREFQTERLDSALIAFRKFTGRKLVEFCRHSMPVCYLQAFGAAAGDDREHRLWQPTQHRESIRSHAFHEQKRNYLHDNPRRKGLVLDAMHWRWSSARWYATGEPCEVPITSVDW